VRVVIADYETFFDSKSGYTLKKMTTEAYIRDQRFEPHGAAVKWSRDSLPQWYDDRELRYILAQEDWSDTMFVAWHNQFDGLILSHHYGIKPRMLGCSMSMARLQIGTYLSVSLDSVRHLFGIPGKITPYNLMDGKHWSEMDQATRDQVAVGAIDEVESIHKIFGMLLRGTYPNGYRFPLEELDVVDSTLKMFCDPELIGDGAVFAKVWQDESSRKQTLLADLGITEADVQSADRFAELLRERGVEPEQKPGKPNPDGSEKLIYAFAKTDPFMEQLQQDEDLEIRALAEARLGAKSTLLQTRAETLGWMASRGPLPVYLRYAGAHTSRWSGGDSTNFQNWTNGSEINTAIIAPEGYELWEPDASQIECRLLNYCAGQTDKIEEFRQGLDPYVSVASAFYRKPINKKDHPVERQLGKIVELQAGYMSGGEKIRQTVRVKSGGHILLTKEEGLQARNAYRDTHPQVVQYWRTADWLLTEMHNWQSHQWGPLKVQCDFNRNTRRIVLPNGIQLIYDSLEWHIDAETMTEYWRIKTRRGWAKLYSGKLVENVIQALARVVVSQAMLRLTALGYRCKNTKHDSLWLLVPIDGRREEHAQIILGEMSRAPAWLPGIPLAAEFKHRGARYA
jgi:hypothetical protein